ncbi:efflux RND transporter periplasmic adaptor subunit [Sunxiuqinia elliptica]|uniref:RND family efflux transporter MFP subunit n=1 Tax=Sunxiuqinia elliptica TaxID=655355 RepID=A0A4R6GUN5_9BACT|nr:efflux RND transporter periplasmic adaptor subunit [Sunxiuqinia elliptica]TDN98957.1 RND family efflux transporter MFP subunit [Sunxiuqinia elliptica]TDO56397.1 RND family efflux transporter MFP subunit [Sunxiuqinia elliptica]
MKKNNFTNHKKAYTRRWSSLFLCLVVLGLYACTSKASQSEETDTSTSLLEEKSYVKTTIVDREDFTIEIISNGKLAAIQKAELYFENPGLIEAINVQNGQSIPGGFQLANLENNSYQFALKKAKLNKEKAAIDKLDVLIGMGYNQSAETINPEHEAIANIRSGYNQALIQYEEASMQLERTNLIAPFSGKIEGITQRQHEKANLSKPFCTLINDKRFFINFPVLEPEIGQISLNQKVSVSPIAGAQTSTGKITEINPRIDENGLIWIKAEVKNPGDYLEGMNVKVSIKKAIPNQLVVPKQAVVLRQNREVLFRYTNGIAFWTYVNVLDENENQYSVEAAEAATLNPGDTIIISNNLNLAHESKVEMEEE